MRSKRLHEQNTDESAEATWVSLDDIPEFPFSRFKDLQDAVSNRKFSIGVDSLAAAGWSARFGSSLNKSLVTLFSTLLIAAAAVSVVAAIWLREYWLMAALPVMAVTFYLSDPGSALHRWVTVGGALSVALFFNLLLNGFRVGAVLVAYSGLTFALVRASGFLANQSFRRALVSDEQAFVTAFGRSECTVRENQTKQVYSVKGVSEQ